MHHHPILQHSKSTGQLDLVPNNKTSADENGNQRINKSSSSKFGLLIRTPRRRRANCLSQLQQQPDSLPTSDEQLQQLRSRSKSWEAGQQRPGKSTWSGWRSLRKISDTLIDYALNEPYKADSLFDDELLAGTSGSAASYRKKGEIDATAVVSAHQPLSSAHRSKTVGHAQGVSGYVQRHTETRNVRFRFRDNQNLRGEERKIDTIFSDQPKKN